MDTFEFRPSEKSPIYRRWSGLDSRRGSWRNSISSVNSTDRGTQTDDLPPYPGSGSISHRSRSSSHNFAMSPIPLDDDEDDEQLQYGDSKTHQTGPVSPTGSAFSKARMVIIPKRAPPPLPPRNSERISAATQLFEKSEDIVDEAAEHSHSEVTAEVTSTQPPPLPQRTGTVEDVAYSQPEEGRKSTPPQSPKSSAVPQRSGSVEALEALAANEDEANKGHHIAANDQKTSTADQTRASASEQPVGHEAKSPDHGDDLERETDDDFHSVADSLEDTPNEHAQTSNLPKASEQSTAVDHGVKRATEEDTSSISHPSISSFEKVDVADEDVNKKPLQPIDGKTDTTALPSEHISQAQSLPAKATYGHEETAVAEESEDKKKAESLDEQAKDSTFQVVTL
ncbi:hypothetical protein KEM54_004088 [Ascosphaera aggregata]|nr:hypothetical protein KEM54_004088 [Ascosphaera aggregata]